MTSGSLYPMLNKNIELAYIDEGFNKNGTEVEIAVRDKKLKAKVVKTHFL